MRGFGERVVWFALCVPRKYWLFAGAFVGIWMTTLPWVLAPLWMIVWAIATVADARQREAKDIAEAAIDEHFRGLEDEALREAGL